MEYAIKKISKNPELRFAATEWFASKWRVPFDAYVESMGEAIAGDGAVPEWYILIDENELSAPANRSAKESSIKIIAGCGVIENDFHDRKDLAPNVCAVFVEDQYRLKGIAGKMLEYVCEDMKRRGIDTLYLITDHISFYERYGWELLCMVQGDDEEELTRMYVHK